MGGRGIFGLISILMVVATLGFMGATSLSSNNIGTSLPTTTVLTTSTTSPSTLVNEAARAACESSAQSLVSALAIFRATTGAIAAGPETSITVGRPSTYPFGTVARQVAQYLASGWPNDPRFALSVSPTTANDIAVYVPARSTTPMSFTHQSAHSGCNAL